MASGKRQHIGHELNLWRLAVLETLPQQVNRALDIRMGGIKLLANVPKKKKKKGATKGEMLCEVTDCLSDFTRN